MAFVGVYAGASLLRWKQDERAEAGVKAEFRELARRIHAVGENAAAQKEFVGLLDELLGQNLEMRARLERAESANPDDPEAAAMAAVAGVLSDLGLRERLDEVEENLRIYLSDLKSRVEEIKDDTGAIRREMVTKGDLDELKQLLNKAIDEKQPRSPDQADARPVVDPGALEAAELVARSPEASLLDRVNAAVLRGDPEALDLLDELDRLREIADFTAFSRRGDYHYFRGEPDAAIMPYEKALALRPDDRTARNNAAIAHSQARLGDIAAHQRRAIEIHEGTLDRFPRETHPLA